MKICLVDLDALSPEDLAFLSSSLGEEERRRLEAMGNPARKTQSLGALYALSVLTGGTLPPMGRSPKGKPYFIKDGSLPFSLSHTDTLSVACLGTHESGAVGVDLERLSRDTRAEGIARRFFDAEEQEILRKAENAPIRFLTLWTRREARGKVTGGGVLSPSDPSLLVRSYLLRREDEVYLLSVAAEGEIGEPELFFVGSPFSHEPISI